MASWAAWKACQLDELAGWMDSREDPGAKSSQLVTAAASQATAAMPIRSRLRGRVTRSLAAGDGSATGQRVRVSSLRTSSTR